MNVPIFMTNYMHLCSVTNVLKFNAVSKYLGTLTATIYLMATIQQKELHNTIRTD